MAIFDDANTADIETGRLAATHGKSQAVRDFGAMIARDHANVRQQGSDLAKKTLVEKVAPAFQAHSLAAQKLQKDLGAK